LPEKPLRRSGFLHSTPILASIGDAKFHGVYHSTGFLLLVRARHALSILLFRCALSASFTRFSSARQLGEAALMNVPAPHRHGWLARQTVLHATILYRQLRTTRHCKSRVYP
jgi:hypothetical protein